MTNLKQPPSARNFPLSAGLILGLGLGGFFDGIVLHQLLQWHHMLSSWYPITTIENLELNTFWDGVFHSGTYVALLIGLFILWRSGRLSHFRWSTRDLGATMLIGFGMFNLVEGIVDHHVLGLHHVNETVARGQWLVWDLGFLAGKELSVLAAYRSPSSVRPLPDRASLAEISTAPYRHD